MSERWYHWYWDRSEVESIPMNFGIIRWRRGFVTFYRYQINIPGTQDQITQWWIYLPGDIGLAINLPAPIARRFKWAHRSWPEETP